MELVDQVIVKLEHFYTEYAKENERGHRSFSKYICPRCGKNFLSRDRSKNAISELSPIDADFYICEHCAFADRRSESIEDFVKWSIASELFEVPEEKNNYLYGNDGTSNQF